MQQPERSDRKVLYWLTRRLFSARCAEAVPPGEAKRILVVRIDERVGNLVTMQSMLDALHRDLPQARVGLLSSDRVEKVTGTLQGIDWSHRLDKRWFLRRHSNWRKVISEVRSVGYQVALDASAWHEFSFTHAALTFFSGAPVRIGFDRGADQGFHTIRVEPGPKDEHELVQRMRLLAPLGMELDPPRLRTSMGADRQDRWEQWFQEKGSRRPRVGIWAGSRKRERRWPVKYYIALADRLVAKGAGSLVVLWGPGEENLRDELLTSLPKNIVAAAPKTSLDDLAAMMRGIDLVVTNDTGPMHLAVAVGTPTVCLFASGDPCRWGHPYSHVRNLVSPGLEPKEVETALEACLQLVGFGGAR
jgi:heptosyltransferase III